MSRVYSAVVDPKSEFILQAHRLVWSLRTLAQVPAEQIVMHIAGSLDGAARASLERLDVELIEVPPYPNHPWCNKLQQLTPLANRKFDEVVLLDCDMVVLRPPKEAENAILAKPVDFSNPPIELLEALFKEAGLVLKRTRTTFGGEVTAWANANGGLYVIPNSCFTTLSRAWGYWASWCLGRKEAFGDYWKHIDQVSFAMAVCSEGLAFDELEAEFNFPTHKAIPTSFDCNPAVIHYHRAVDAHQNLLHVPGLPQVNATIDQVNLAWSRYFREHFDNCAFWNSRYAQQPDLGSGIGSRGEFLRSKQLLLAEVVRHAQAQTVLDIGGGDGKTTSCLNKTVAVVAIDVSTESKAHYMNAVPRADWYLHNICEAPFKNDSDLTVCLDLLIHLATMNDYQRAMDNICQSSRNLLLSGFEAPPVSFGPITYYHEPLSVSLKQRRRLAIPVASYRDLTVFFSPCEDELKHSRGIKNSTLQAAIPLVQNPLLLIEALSTSRQMLGFFPDHLPRCIEYPWVIEILQNRQGLRVLDAGAGVSPLSLMLASRGHKVTTVDPHLVDRTKAAKDTWTEWGFLDYSTLDNRIESLNTGYQDTDDNLLLDAVVSVSVIEHLTRQTRLCWLQKASRQLREGGELLLTVDTVPFSRLLWNFSEGKQVDDDSLHGDLPILLGEIEKAGFVVEQFEHANWLPLSRVGMARIRARRVGANHAVANSSELNLDIGGQLNRNDQDGKWKIVDLHDGADFRVNLEQELLPCANGSVDNVYSSHCLEHLEPGRLRPIFADIYRVLKPGGCFRMIVPSFVKGVALYTSNPEKLRGRWMPRINSNTPDTKMSRLSSWFYTEANPKNGTPGHKTAWDFELAQAYLSEAGFCRIRECSLADCSPVFAGKDNPLYEDFSLYVECVK